MKTLYIDANFRVDGDLLALKSVYFPTLVEGYAQALGRGWQIALVTTDDVLKVLEQRFDSNIDGCIIKFMRVADVPDHAIRFCISDIHHPLQLRQHLKRNDQTLPDAVWTIKTAEDIDRSAATLERFDMYVVARIFVIPIAKRIATKLQTTNVSPNTITTLSALSGIIAGLMLLSDQLIYRVLSALMIHASITLDFADGYLARLKGIESKFGYWFDTLMDEAVKISLFAAIAANFVLHDKLLWGFLAIATLALYHILSINHWLSSALSGQDTTASAKSTTVRTPGIFGAAKRWLTRLSYLDVHLYLIAATAITNTLEIAIILFLGLYSASFFRLIQTRFSTQAIN